MPRLFNKNSRKKLRRHLRKQLSPSELLLWSKLKGKQTGFKFRRQYSIGRYVVDFYCPKAKLALEADGKTHFDDESILYDARRDKYIENLGIKVIRFTNNDVYENLEGVVLTIANEVKQRKASE